MNDVEFLDHEAPFSYTDGLTVQQIAVNHLRFLGYQFSDDMSGGRWESIPMASGQVVQRWIPDRRAVCFHSVDYLMILCEPYFDDEAESEAQKAHEWFNQKLNQAREENEASERSVMLFYAKKRLRVLSRWLARSDWLTGSKGLEDSIV